MTIQTNYRHNQTHHGENKSQTILFTDLHRLKKESYQSHGKNLKSFILYRLNTIYRLYRLIYIRKYVNTYIYPIYMFYIELRKMTLLTLLTLLRSKK